MRYSLGIDFGTSGARSVVIDSLRNILFAGSIKFPEKIDQDNLTNLWKESLYQLILDIPAQIREHITKCAIDGTSSTVMICDDRGQPLLPPLLYNDDRGQAVMDQVQAIAPPQHLVHSATSSFTKLLWYGQQPEIDRAKYFLHQADWLSFLLHGQLGISDYHNALKLGYDVSTLSYPPWLTNHPLFPLLPHVLPPASPIGKVQPQIPHQLNLNPDLTIYTGTTDSIGAFLASGAYVPGTAVTSLGSTLVVKLLSQIKVESITHGVYSHRCGDLWLVGGASNTGGAVLKHFFSDQDLAILSSQINPNIPSSLDYYPLLKSGERFPVNNPHLCPKLDPRPPDDVTFLYGLLESMAKIEKQGYELLRKLGATPLIHVYTAGGGAKNEKWTTIRQRHLGVPVTISPNADAAFGTALLTNNQFRKLFKTYDPNY